MHRNRNGAPRAAHLPYPDTHRAELTGKNYGNVNFSRLPAVASAEEVHMALFAPLGANLGAVILPYPSGSHMKHTEQEVNYGLRINIFSDTHGQHGQPSFVLASDKALEKISLQAFDDKATKPTLLDGIITLNEGNVLYVGRDHWLPLVGTAVGSLSQKPALQEMYSSVHSDQGLFHVYEGELHWIDTGLKNRSEIIHGGLEPEHQGEQSFVATGQIAMGGVFTQPPRIESFSDTTGH